MQQLQAQAHTGVSTSINTAPGDVACSKYWITLMTYRGHAPGKFSVYQTHENFKTMCLD